MLRSPRLFLTISLLLIHVLGFSQGHFKKLLKAAQDSTNQQRYSAAVKLLQKAKSLKGKTAEYSEIINMYLGNNYEALNKIDSCIFYYGEAVKFSEAKKDYASLSFLFNRLGTIELSITCRYEPAIRYFKKQITYVRLLKDSTTLLYSYNNLGIAFKSLNQLDSAIYYFKKVSGNRSKYNDSRNVALLLIADTYSLQKKYPIALAYYDKAIQALKSANDSSYLFNAYANKGDCLMQQDEFEESLLSFVEAKNRITISTPISDKAALYKNFAEVYSRQKDFSNAYYFKNLESITKDSINTQSIANAVAEMSAKYDLRQKQDSLFISQQKLALSDIRSEERLRNFIIILAVSIGLGLFLINSYRIKQLRLKNRLQRQEAEQNAQQLIHQYQLSESELKAIRSQMNPHFIFNGLNSIESYIMDNDKQTASRLIQKFASLSRLILENSTKSMVVAEREWKALILYTELEAMRYSNSFSYHFVVEDQLRLENLLLPPMLIQPLIENAILHGLIEEPKPDAHLEVKLEQLSGNLCISVADNGIGIDHNLPKPKYPGSIKEKSMGLASIRERIEMLNIQSQTDVASLKIAPGNNKRGTLAKICLPIIYLEA